MKRDEMAWRSLEQCLDNDAGDWKDYVSLYDGRPDCFAVIDRIGMLKLRGIGQKTVSKLKETLERHGWTVLFLN